MLQSSAMVWTVVILSPLLELNAGPEFAPFFFPFSCSLSHDNVPFRDFAVPCGPQNDLTVNLFKKSLGSEALVPFQSTTNNFISSSFFLLSPSLQSDPHLPLVPMEATEIAVQVCNIDVCTDFLTVSVPVCEVENQDELVVEGLEEAAGKLEGEDLEEALQTMLAVGESVTECSQVQVLSNLIDQYISASLAAVDGNATNLPDTTTLMEVFIFIFFVFFHILTFFLPSCLGQSERPLVTFLLICLIPFLRYSILSFYYYYLYFWTH